MAGVFNTHWILQKGENKSVVFTTDLPPKLQKGARNHIQSTRNSRNPLLARFSRSPLPHKNPYIRIFSVFPLLQTRGRSGAARPEPSTPSSGTGRSRAARGEAPATNSRRQGKQQRLRPQLTRRAGRTLPTPQLPRSPCRPSPVPQHREYLGGADVLHGGARSAAASRSHSHRAAPAAARAALPGRGRAANGAGPAPRTTQRPRAAGGGNG